MLISTKQLTWKTCICSDSLRYHWKPFPSQMNQRDQRGKEGYTYGRGEAFGADVAAWIVQDMPDKMLPQGGRSLEVALAEQAHVTHACVHTLVTSPLLSEPIRMLLVSASRTMQWRFTQKRRAAHTLKRVQSNWVDQLCNRLLSKCSQSQPMTTN